MARRPGRGSETRRVVVGRSDALQLLESSTQRVLVGVRVGHDRCGVNGLVVLTLLTAGDDVHTGLRRLAAQGGGRVSDSSQPTGGWVRSACGGQRS